MGREVIVCNFKMIVLIILFSSFNAFANEVCQILSGAKIIAQDGKNTFLGSFTNPYNSNSIFNEYGTYGSQYNSLSVFNSYGEFGSEYNQYSATNSNSYKPPMLIKNQNIFGYLSANKNIQGSISPNLAKALCADVL